MAIINKEIVSKSKFWQCDKCGKLKPYSLSEELKSHCAGELKWLVQPEGNKALCPKCELEIISAWYNHQEAVNFCLKSA